MEKPKADNLVLRFRLFAFCHLPFFLWLKTTQNSRIFAA
jgi:hypothetical protein